MKNINSIILFLLAFIQPVVLYSQETGFIPPSPQSFSFVKATNVVSENEHTGAANVSIPLFTYRANKLSTDVSILYSGAGVKVDDLPNDAGMTWIINAGGVITRTVNGLIDEKATMRMNKSEAELIQKTASDCAADEEIRTACYTPAQMDTERDIFDFRFADMSGSFYLDQNFLPVFLKNESDVKIKNVLPAGENNNRKFTGFEITTKEGVKYVFGGSIEYWETTASKAMPANPPGDYAVTSFFLKEIEYMSGEKIFFNYENTDFVTNKISEIHSRYLYSCCLNGGIMPNVDPELKISTQTHYTRNKKRLQFITNNQNSDATTFIYTEKANSDFKKYLSAIEYKINNVTFKKINFNYLFEDIVSPQTIQRFYLTGINFYNGNTNFEKKYQFNYNDPLDLPKRLSYGQDMYGYFNGKMNNESLIAGFFGNQIPLSSWYQPSILASFGDRRPDFLYASKGVLKEVVYPTGGKTKFEYESPKTKAIFSTKVYMGEDPLSSNGTVTKIIENLHFDQNINYTFTTYSGPGSGNHMKVAEFEVRNMDTNQLIHSQGKSYGYTLDSINGSFYLQQNKRYLISFTPRGAADLKFSYSHKDPIDNFGVRLKSVIHSESGQNNEYKRFYYRPASLYAVNEENLALIDMEIIPNIQYTTFEEFHEGVSLGVNYAVHSSSNSSALYNSRLQERYSFVTCSIGGDNFENGGYQKTFRKDSDDPLQRIAPASAGGSGAGSPSAGHGYFNYIKGLPNFFGIILNSIYFPAKGNRLSFSGTLNNTKYYVKRNGNIYKNKQVQNQYRYNILSTNPNLFVSQAFDDPTMGNCPTGSVQRIANFYISIYKNYTIETKLERETVTDYIDEVPVTFYNNYDDYLAVDSLGTSESAYRKLITTTDYKYSGMPAHSQVTQQITISPEGGITETNYKYAHEKGNQLMIDRNMVGIPLETTTTQTKEGVTKTLGKTETLYPTSVPTAQSGSLLLPLSVKSSDQLTGVMSTEASYDKYDEKGNILQYTTRDGIPVTIVWGYNKTQPIAKVEGITYDQLTSLASPTAIVTASDNDAADPSKEGLLLEALNSFRKNSQLTDKKVTTYTYDPLIGVTSITPPSGIRQVFTYDPANRLRETKVRSKDTTGAYTDKKAAEYKYNYKP